MSITETLVHLGNDICLSGGAEGADLQWGMMAGKCGHRVIHWSFVGHRTDAPDSELVRLAPASLEEADPYLFRASKRLKRRYSRSKQTTMNLLRRNYYQSRWTNSLYAVGNIEKGKIEGGTAWAVQIYMDRFKIDGEPMEDCRLYFYDQKLDQWMTWKGEWSIMTSPPPRPSGIWTGIGTRELSDKGKWAIRNLMGW